MLYLNHSKAVSFFLKVLEFKNISPVFITKLTQSWEREGTQGNDALLSNQINRLGHWVFIDRSQMQC